MSFAGFERSEGSAQQECQYEWGWTLEQSAANCYQLWFRRKELF